MVQELAEELQRKRFSAARDPHSRARSPMHRRVFKEERALEVRKGIGRNFIDLL